LNKGEDEQYLQLLSIFHYIVAGLAALIACFPIIHLTVGIGMIIAALSGSSEAAPMALVGVFFVLIGGSIILFGWAFAVCVALAGRFLALRRHHTFCLVMAGVECAFTPFGTVLGVFTLIVITRASVKELFLQQTTAVESQNLKLA
jgi:hypothetical protein